MRAAFENGINFFDTAPAYGAGHSETLIGETFAAKREQVVIATKGGMRRFDEPADYAPDALRKSLEESLRRLKTDYVDLYQLHSPPEEVLNAPGAVNDLIDSLRREGVIRAFGVSVARPEDGILAMDRFDIDAIQANFSLVDQRALDCGLLAEAKDREVAVIARTPLCFGLLSGNYDRQTRFDPADHRSRWSPEQIERWVDAADRFAMASDCPQPQSKAQVALRYCLSFSAVCTTIPGMMTEDEVHENAAAGGLGPLSSAELDAARNIYQSDSFFVNDR